MSKLERMYMAIFGGSEVEPKTFTDEKPRNIKDESIKGMSGFENLSDAAAKAPSSETDILEAPAPRKRKPTYYEQRKLEEERIRQEQAAKEARKREAFDAVGRDIMADVAEIPYDVWAFLASDSRYALTPDEQKSLADKYFLIAQALEPDFSSVWWLAFAAISANAKCVRTRVMMPPKKGNIEGWPPQKQSMQPQPERKI